MVAAATLLLAAPPQGAAQVANEELVTAQPDLIDPEFSESRGMITWVDVAGRLWVADVDPDTGGLIPADGKGTLVDPRAMLLKDLQVTGNGPEWIPTAQGDRIVYTRFLPRQPHSLENARLAVAEYASSGWTARYLLPLLPRSGPYASQDPGDPSPRISYVDDQGNHYWRYLDVPSSEAPIDGMPRSRLSARFVAGEHALVYAAPVAGISQVFVHDLLTGLARQATFDEGQKDLHTVPWAWRAGEFDNDLVLATVVDATELRIYRLEAGASEWTSINRLQTPQGGIISSPEPFDHAGRSYVTFSASIPPYREPSAVFLAAVDPLRPMMVQLTPDLPVRIRRDPEVFVTSDGPFIYFNRLTVSDQRYCLSCNEGLYRSYTGLPPAGE